MIQRIILTFLILSLSNLVIGKGSSLDRVSITKMLRVGTTGDYEPFSFYEKDKLTGIDIQLARKLGFSLVSKWSL